jgi:transposase InsO family protein
MNNRNKHSKFSLQTRLLAVDRVLKQNWKVSAAAAAISASRQIVYRWLRRFKAEGAAGLTERSSRPLRSPTRLAAGLVATLAALRALGHSLNAIVQQLRLVRSTVWRWLLRLGLNRRPRPSRAPVLRYEAAAPGALVHLDVKKLRGFDWAGRKFTEDGGAADGGRGGPPHGAPRLYLHVAIDDHSRYACARIYPRENAQTCLDFIREVQAHFAALGVRIQRLLTDNGSAYRSLLLNAQLPELGLAHSFTRVRRPQMSGKAERFIRTAMEEWGSRRYDDSRQRDAALPAWLAYYNQQRNHSAIGHKAPVSRLPLSTTS